MPVYKDDNKKWYVKCSYIDKFGKRKYKTKRGFTKRSDAVDWENDFFKALERDEVVDGLAFETLANDYLEWYTKRRKASSVKTIRNYIQTHIIPYFGSINVHEVTTKEILKFHDHLIGKGLSRGYIQDIHTCLTSVFKHGIRFYDLKRNAASIAGNIENNERTKWRYWTRSQFDIFYDYLERHEDIFWQLYFRLLFYSGLRHGEQRALTWNDVDFDEGFVDINKNNYNGIVDTPKTKSSERRVYLPSHVMSLFEQYKAAYKEMQPYKDSYVVFGKFYQSIGETTVQRKYNSIMKEVDLSPIKIHEFRHSHASDCINRLNMDRSTLAKRLGHTSSQTVEKVYGHLYPSTEKSAIDQL